MEKKSKTTNMIATWVELSVVIPMSYPLDTLKSRLQTNYYKDYMHAKSHLNNLSNIKGLYRGMSVLYSGLLIKQPIKMVSFECANDPFYGSVVAGASGIIIGLPLSFIKTNYQTNDVFRLNYKDKLNIFKNLPFFGAWKYEASKEMIGNIMFLSTYGYLRRHNNYFGDKYVGTLNFANGVLSSILTTFVVYPVDLLKVRKQTIQRNEKLRDIFNSVVCTNNENNISKNKFEISQYKIKNLWKGITPVFIRVSFFGGIGMYVYEKVRSVLN